MGDRELHCTAQRSRIAYQVTASTSCLEAMSQPPGLFSLFPPFSPSVVVVVRDVGVPVPQISQKLTQMYGALAVA